MQHPTVQPRSDAILWARRLKTRVPALAVAVRWSRRTLNALLFHALPHKLLLQLHYFQITRQWPDLDDPRDFSEKLTADKLRPASPLEIQCADKILVRDYVASHYGTAILIPALLCTYNVEEIRSDNIHAEKFVIKTNHDSGTVVICRDRENFDWADARRYLKNQLNLNFFYHAFEPQYRAIHSGLIVEKFLENTEGEEIADYKFFCFHGVPKLVQIDVDRFSAHRRAFFDPQWRRVELQRASRGVPAVDGDLTAPARLTDMLDCARRLAAPFRFCRVDLYEAEGNLWFGELTFRPLNGAARYKPDAWERRLGDWLASPSP